MSREHELKTWPEPFQAIVDGRKRFEVRLDDRGFAEGDTLVLREFLPEGGSLGGGYYTRRSVRARVRYIAHGGRWGLPANLCVMSITVDDTALRASQNEEVGR